MELSSESNQLRLNLGCGKQRIEGFVGVDLDPSAEMVADIRNLPVADGVVDHAMAIHVLEHLPRWEAPKALAEWYRVLKPGSVLAVEVPDLHACCNAILNGADDRFGLWGLFGDPGYQSELMVHRWAYSKDELVREFRAAGFRKIRLKPPVFHKKLRDFRIEGTK